MHYKCSRRVLQVQEDCALHAGSVVLRQGSAPQRHTAGCTSTSDQRTNDGCSDAVHKQGDAQGGHKQAEHPSRKSGPRLAWRDDVQKSPWDDEADDGGREGANERDDVPDGGDEDSHGVGSGQQADGHATHKGGVLVLVTATGQKGRQSVQGSEDRSDSILVLVTATGQTQSVQGSMERRDSHQRSVEGTL